MTAALLAPPSATIVLGGFVAAECLWTGATPMFPSEQSARWYMRRNRSMLVEAKAIAVHTGRIMIHRERFEAAALAMAMGSAAHELV